MKRLLIATLAFGFAFAVHAEPVTGEKVEQDKSVAVQTEQVSQETTANSEVSVAETSVNEPDDRNFLRHTGSRLIGKDRSRACANAPGRAYTRDDLARTGAMDTLTALRMLDPSIR